MTTDELLAIADAWLYSWATTDYPVTEAIDIVRDLAAALRASEKEDERLADGWVAALGRAERAEARVTDLLRKLDEERTVINEQALRAARAEAALVALESHLSSKHSVMLIEAEREVARARGLLESVERLASSQEGVTKPSESMALSKLSSILGLVRAFLAGHPAPEPAGIPSSEDCQDRWTCCVHSPEEKP